jgi:hypothetical protein
MQPEIHSVYLQYLAVGIARSLMERIDAESRGKAEVLKPYEGEARRRDRRIHDSRCHCSFNVFSPFLCFSFEALTLTPGSQLQIPNSAVYRLWKLHKPYLQRFVFGANFVFEHSGRTGCVLFPKNPGTPGKPFPFLFLSPCHPLTNSDHSA